MIISVHIAHMRILSTQENIEDSRERRMTKKSEFACTECEYKSPSKTLLKRHVESAHKFTCDQCEHKVSSKSNLKTHEIQSKTRYNRVGRGNDNF